MMRLTLTLKGSRAVLRTAPRNSRRGKTRWRTLGFGKGILSKRRMAGDFLMTMVIMFVLIIKLYFFAH